MRRERKYALRKRLALYFELLFVSFKETGKKIHETRSILVFACGIEGRYALKKNGVAEKRKKGK